MIEYPLIMTSGGPGSLTMTLPLFMYYEMTRAREFGLTMAAGLTAIVFGTLFMSIVFIVQRALDRRWS
jgi:ABC-type sugar transport system permease subunit